MKKIGVRKGMKKRVKKGIAISSLAAAASLAAELLFLTLREYRPGEEEELKVSDGKRRLKSGDALTLLTYNTGYAGLDCAASFFMDGGRDVLAKSKKRVMENLAGITSILREQAADVYFLQETDLDSRRSYHVNENAYYERALHMRGMYARNLKCDFIPFPIPFMGKVDSGILTLTDYAVREAKRISLPESFRWPVKTCNLKRCLLLSRVPVKGSKKELVLVNLHLEAYDDGAGKRAQSQRLWTLLEEEYKKGNYVIAGGDFNQTFEGYDTYPIRDTRHWTPGVILRKELPDGFSFAAADNVPTCRQICAPYSGNYEDSQVFLIDGFIVSDNVEVRQVKNVDVGFVWTDHQPVRLEVSLR